MTTSTTRAATLCALLATTALAAPAYATATPPEMEAAPERSSIDGNGVDLVTGRFSLATTDVSIGPNDHRGLAYSRFWTGSSWRDNLVATIHGNPDHIVVSVGGAAEAFTRTATAWVSDEATGATLSVVDGQYLYTTSDGTEVMFTARGGNYDVSVTTIGWVAYIKYADGTRVDYNYRTDDYCQSLEGNSCPTPTKLWTRVQSVTTNTGYQLKFDYAGNVLTEGTDLNAWRTIAKVTAINNRVESCTPTADSCTLTGDWASATYSKSVSGPDTFFSVTNAENATVRYRMQGTRIVGIKRPTGSSDSVTITYDPNGRVATVDRLGQAWSYAYTDTEMSGETQRTTTVTDPLSEQSVIVSDLDEQLIKSSTDPLARTTSFEYDEEGRLLKRIGSEGNALALTYDGRGNVTSRTAIAKPGSSLGNIVTSATFVASCDNPRICNKPLSTTDAAGRTTNYTYSTVHGGATRVLAPAQSSGGIRADMRYFYSQIGPVHALTGTSTCQTGAYDCAGTDDEVKTTIGYGTAGTSNDLLPRSVASGAGDGSLTATSSATYDAVGNILTSDGPLAGTADLVLYRYDKARRAVGIFSPDPDGAGALKHRAQRMTYNADGQVTLAETGTVTSQTDAAWSAMSVTETGSATYNVRGQKIRDMLIVNGATEALIQYSYDAAGRLACTAQRMNPAQFGIFPSPCSQGVAGAFGPDRISRNFYDPGGQLILVRSGIGTTDLRNDVATTYGDSGQVSTVTDGEGNVTAYDYDGHGRLAKTLFSDQSYEGLSYDGGSRLSQRRLRDGQLIGFSYDGVGRLAAKDLPGAEEDVSYAYDNLGRATSVTQGIHTSSFSHDALGRVLSETARLGTKSYAYDLAGRRTRLTHPDGFAVEYDYLATGEVSAIREQGETAGLGVIASFGYDDGGRRTSLTRGNGLVTSYGYDALSRLETLTNNIAGTASDLTLGFTYNPAGQIASGTRSNDAYAWTGHANGTASTPANALNQLTEVGGVATTHDARGNMTSDGTKSYTYSSENRMTAAGGVALGYDALGRLYSLVGPSVNKRFVYDGAEIIAETDSGGTVLKRYVHGPGSDEPLIVYEGAAGARRWLHADERGSIVAASDYLGQKVYTNTYDDYGKPADTNQGLFQYTGQAWLGETGLYHYKARMYNPRLPRFMQTDPIGYGDGMNMYAYTRGDPVNGSDPSGLGCQTETGSRVNTCANSYDQSPGVGSNISGYTCQSCMGSFPGSMSTSLTFNFFTSTAAPQYELTQAGRDYIARCAASADNCLKTPNSTFTDDGSSAGVHQASSQYILFDMSDSPDALREGVHTILLLDYGWSKILRTHSQISHGEGKSYFFSAWTHSKVGLAYLLRPILNSGRWGGYYGQKRIEGVSPWALGMTNKYGDMPNEISYTARITIRSTGFPGVWHVTDAYPLRDQRRLGN